ncbi:glycosyltransferase, partial [candidate division WOR-3 bacterium]|nr:glycosyltransferase [candidate division WOR-3 bacterium]
WEGVIVPSKIYGIMAVGSPIVYVGPDSDTSWTIEKHNCGFVVRSGSVDEFVEKIKEFYYDEELRKEMASNARKGFEKEYTKEKGIERYLSVLAP